MADLHTDSILCNFPLCLRKNIEQLCLRSQIGLGFVSLEDISVLSNRNNSEEEPLANFHFIIKIPYAGKRLKWEIIFDPEDFYFAPNFDFNDDNFLNDPDYEIIGNNIPSLADWDLHDPESLSQVLNEFILLYKKLQIEKLLQDNIYSRYCEEYQLLISDVNGVDSKDVELYIDGTNVHFMISLQVDCSSLPEYLQPPKNDHTAWFNPGEDYAHLKISILKLDGTRTNITLQLSPRLEQILGNARNMALPDYKREMSLIEYVSKVAQMIENRIKLVALHFKMKKAYIMSLAAACSQSIVEYDTDSFNKAVLLYKVGNYGCLVTVTVGARFPLEKPSVHLSSIYCQEGRQCNENVDKYPYNSNLQPDHSVEALLEYLPEAVLRFKSHKH